MKFAFTMLGLAELRLFFRLMKRGGQDFGEAWVGSAVIYGPMQEFGTRFLTERPHWRVAIPEIIAEAGGDQQMQNEVLDAMIAREINGKLFTDAKLDAGTTAPIKVALMIERRVKQIITAKGIIDTGNYRASITTGRNADDVYEDSVSLATDGTTV